MSENMTRSYKIKAEEAFPVSVQGYTKQKLLDSSEYQILFDTGACKCFRSNSHFRGINPCNLFPMFAPETKSIQEGNEYYVSILFIIPVLLDIHGNQFRIFILISEMHENVDLVLRVKNIFELKGIINSW